MIRYEEIANLSENEDGKEDVAKATENGMVSPIILRLLTAMLMVYACLRSGNKTFAQLPWYYTCMSIT